MDLSRVKPKSLIQQKVRTPVPRLVIAKKYGYDQCGILMPNAYFDDLTSWGRHMDHLVELVKTSPFEARDGATKGQKGASMLLQLAFLAINGITKRMHPTRP